MIGGSSDAFIGAVHRKAAALDGFIELVCGAFSSNPEKSKATGKSLFLPDDRVYAHYEEMIEKEKSLPEDKRMDFVSIVTPNHLHFAPAVSALKNGFHVILDKPMTLSLNEARKLEKVVENSGRIFALTHTYTGYPMVKEARNLIQKGALGTIRKIYVEYTQGWLSQPIERTGQKQATWRADPRYSGKGGAIADIGTHAANLAEYISGVRISEVCADLRSVVEGRVLDDDASILLKFENGASGVLIATQVAAGEENNLSIRIYGEKGGLEWHQEEPNTLIVKWPDKPRQILRTAMPYVSQQARYATRVPSGHPEGYLEAFANIYVAFAHAVNDFIRGKKKDAESYGFPGVHEGVRGMAFIEAAVQSSARKQKWVPIMP